MKKLLICLDKKDFFDAPLYKSVFKEVFSNNKFCFKDYTSFSKDLDNPKYLEKNFNECEPEIE